MVLLDVDDGVGDAVGLEGGHGEWHFAVEDVESEFQLHERGAGFCGAGVE